MIISSVLYYLNLGCVLIKINPYTYVLHIRTYPNTPAGPKLSSGNPMKLHAGVGGEAVDGGSAGRRRRRGPENGIHEVHHGTHGWAGRESAGLGLDEHREAAAAIIIIVSGSAACCFMSHEASCGGAVLRVRIGRAAQPDEVPVDGVLEMIGAGEEQRVRGEIGPSRWRG